MYCRAGAGLNICFSDFQVYVYTLAQARLSNVVTPPMLYLRSNHFKRALPHSRISLTSSGKFRVQRISFCEWELLLPDPLCGPLVTSSEVRNQATSLLPSLTSFSALIVPCSACLWFLRNFGSVPLREGYRKVFGFLIL